jgi:multiple sugar transport system permease protein
MLRHAALIVISVLAILPFAWMVSTSLKSLEATMEYPPRLLPDPIQWHNYADVFRHGKANFLLWTRNTVIIALLGVVGTTVSSAIVAYGFARLRFIGRGPLFVVMLSTMMLPFPVTMVSLYAMFRWLGDVTGTPWIGTFKPLWVPLWFGSAFNIFLLRQFFMTIPTELSEAARIDGCSELGIFWRIILPLSRPALAVVALFAFMGIWNDFLGPLVPRAAGLSPAARTVHSRAGSAKLPEPGRRNKLAPADGRQHPGHPAGDSAVLPGAKDLHPGNRDDGDERMSDEACCVVRRGCHDDLEQSFLARPTIAPERPQLVEIHRF